MPEVTFVETSRQRRTSADYGGGFPSGVNRFEYKPAIRTDYTIGKRALSALKNIRKFDTPELVVAIENAGRNLNGKPENKDKA